MMERGYGTLPVQLYDKDQILDDCLAVFARHGYKNTSTVMLAEAAGVSKALIFHHFKSKKELYLSVLDRCFERARQEVGIDPLAEYQDFFEAIEKYTPIKLDYLKKNPNVYKVVREVFYATPNELKEAIEEKYGPMITDKYKVWWPLFEKVPLKEGINRGQAFELTMITLDHFESTFITDEEDIDEKYFQDFLDKMNSFLSMIRYGIQQ